LNKKFEKTQCSNEKSKEDFLIETSGNQERLQTAAETAQDPNENSKNCSSTETDGHWQNPQNSGKNLKEDSSLRATNNRKEELEKNETRPIQKSETVPIAAEECNKNATSKNNENSKNGEELTLKKDSERNSQLTNVSSYQFSFYLILN